MSTKGWDNKILIFNLKNTHHLWILLSQGKGFFVQIIISSVPTSVFKESSASLPQSMFSRYQLHRVAAEGTEVDSVAVEDADRKEKPKGTEMKKEVVCILTERILIQKASYI